MKTNKIKLRGKIWKQITGKEFDKLQRKKNLAMFIDFDLLEITYFKEINYKTIFKEGKQ